jgi:hypothetical protein
VRGQRAPAARLRPGASWPVWLRRGSHSCIHRCKPALPISIRVFRRHCLSAAWQAGVFPSNARRKRRRGRAKLLQLSTGGGDWPWRRLHTDGLRLIGFQRGADEHRLTLRPIIEISDRAPPSLRPYPMFRAWLIHTGMLRPSLLQPYASAAMPNEASAHGRVNVHRNFSNGDSEDRTTIADVGGWHGSFCLIRWPPGGDTWRARATSAIPAEQLLHS